MRDLIERVAEKAGWRKTAPPLAYYFIEEWWPLATFDGKLSAEGLVFLLRELLAAGKSILPLPDGRVLVAQHQGKESGWGKHHFADDTLEEAVMAAYLAHKGER